MLPLNNSAEPNRKLPSTSPPSRSRKRNASTSKDPRRLVLPRRRRLTNSRISHSTRIVFQILVRRCRARLSLKRADQCIPHHLQIRSYLLPVRIALPAASPARGGHQYHTQMRARGQHRRLLEITRGETFLRDDLYFLLMTVMTCMGRGQCIDSCLFLLVVSSSTGFILYRVLTTTQFIAIFQLYKSSLISSLCSYISPSIARYWSFSFALHSQIISSGHCTSSLHTSHLYPRTSSSPAFAITYSHQALYILSFQRWLSLDIFAVPFAFGPLSKLIELYTHPCSHMPPNFCSTQNLVSS